MVATKALTLLSALILIPPPGGPTTPTKPLYDEFVQAASHRRKNHVAIRSKLILDLAPTSNQRTKISKLEVADEAEFKGFIKEAKAFPKESFIRRPPGGGFARADDDGASPPRPPTPRAGPLLRALNVSLDKKFRAGLAQVFTKKQYRAYEIYWHERRVYSFLARFIQGIPGGLP